MLKLNNFVRASNWTEYLSYNAYWKFVLTVSMSYRKHGFWVLIERCFKQTAMKYVDYSIKLSPYRQFCCPLSLIYALSFANIPVSPRFFGEFEPDMLTFSARHFEKPLIPSSTQPTRKPSKAALNPNG